MEFSEEIIEVLSIDCIIFGFKNAELNVLLVKHGIGLTKGSWALPGSWIKFNESIDDAAIRILTAQTAVENIFLEQFKSYGNLERFPSKRVITICYFALVNIEQFVLKPGPTESDVKWFNIHKIPNMPFDHNLILKESFLFLKHKIQHEPIGFNLLPKKFTLFQLQNLYEAILEQKLDKPNFRRKIMKMNMLVATNDYQQDVSHRAAMLYKFDETIYNKLIDKGFIFEV